MKKSIFHITSFFIITVMILGATFPAMLSFMHCDMMMANSEMEHSNMETMTMVHHSADEMSIYTDITPESAQTTVDCDCVYMDEPDKVSGIFTKKLETSDFVHSLIYYIQSDFEKSADVKKNIFGNTKAHSPPPLFLKHSSFLI